MRNLNQLRVFIQFLFGSLVTMTKNQNKDYIQKSNKKRVFKFELRINFDHKNPFEFSAHLSIENKISLLKIQNLKVTRFQKSKLNETMDLFRILSNFWPFSFFNSTCNTIKPSDSLLVEMPRMDLIKDTYFDILRFVDKERIALQEVNFLTRQYFFWTNFNAEKIFKKYKNYTLCIGLGQGGQDLSNTLVGTFLARLNRNRWYIMFKNTLFISLYGSNL
ncbi:hypothetical protein BpHYR1_038507 [Brachionus plicatilis]|uniref:Ycf2 n=1 Tax=Brachionus plicatilis TaxID=10195 RepID=A0A3M7PDQ4_BRAPC|nr:hypothetical protein BpHYR1_038507 [Brachionus plicatilis]